MIRVKGYKDFYKQEFRFHANHPINVYVAINEELNINVLPKGFKDTYDF